MAAQLTRVPALAATRILMQWATAAMGRLEEIKSILSDILAGKRIEDTSAPAPACGPVSFPADFAGDGQTSAAPDAAPPESTPSPVERNNAARGTSAYPAVAMAPAASAVPPPDYAPPVAESVPPPYAESDTLAEAHSAGCVTRCAWILAGAGVPDSCPCWPAAASPALPHHPYASLSSSLGEVHRSAMRESVRSAEAANAGQAVPPSSQPPPSQPQQQQQQQRVHSTGIPAPPPAFSPPVPARTPAYAPPSPYQVHSLGAPPSRPSSILNEADQRIYLREWCAGPACGAPASARADAPAPTAPACAACACRKGCLAHFSRRQNPTPTREKTGSRPWAYCAASLCVRCSGRERLLDPLTAPLRRPYPRSTRMFSRLHTCCSRRKWGSGICA